MRCLVTGATGYIGGRLVGRLLDEGHEVRCMTRDRSRLRDLPWVDQVEVVEADATDPDAVRAAVQGIEVLYYLIHSIGGPDDFATTDRLAAHTVADASAAAGVRRIVYLGGLSATTPAALAPALSAHLGSRDEVGRILLSSGVPTAALRAAVILGSGSLSFEMMRYLTERLPVVVAPRWVRTRIQPIAVRDVLRYLVGCADLPPEVSRTFDIGGPDVLTYVEMMQRYARVAGLRPRVIVPVPVLSPWLSSHWVNVVTPVPARLARPLVHSLVNEVVCTEHDIAEHVPDPPEGLVGFDRGVALALVKIRDAEVETRWSGASWPDAPSDSLPTDPAWAGGSLYVDDRRTEVDAPAAALWTVIEGIGGEHGWHSFPLAWEVRGWMDRVVGGVGLRRGRRDPHSLMVGEALDFWRVEEIEPGHLLRLRAEMKVPGLAWLELTATPLGEDRSEFRQRAVFSPRGLLGHAYWWAVVPFHGVVFAQLHRNVARAARRAAAPEEVGSAGDRGRAGDRDGAADPGGVGTLRTPGRRGRRTPLRPSRGPAPAARR